MVGGKNVNEGYFNDEAVCLEVCEGMYCSLEGNNSALVVRLRSNGVRAKCNR